MGNRQSGNGAGTPSDDNQPQGRFRVVSQGAQMPLFYKKPIALCPEQHADLYLEQTGFQHAAASNSVYITAVEFLKVAREYPIVFAGNAEQGIAPVALLGLDPECNLYLNDDGQWRGDYIPAYVRRYPFILATGEGTTAQPDRFTVCIDEACPGLNRQGRGQRLFSEDGQQSDTLSAAIRLLREYQGHIHLTSEFCTALADLAILEPMAATFSTETGDRRRLQGFMGVNEEKLRALAPDQLAELISRKYLDLIFAHLWSLVGLETLRTRWQQTRPNEKSKSP